jgi:hypothetical protein
VIAFRPEFSDAKRHDCGESRKSARIRVLHLEFDTAQVGRMQILGIGSGGERGDIRRIARCARPDTDEHFGIEISSPIDRSAKAKTPLRNG